MKNVHVKFVGVIIALLVVSIVVVIKKPIREGLDIRGGMRVVLRAKTEELRGGKKWLPENLDTTRAIIQRRVDALGVSEPVVYTQPETNRIVVELPGLTNKQQARDSIQTTAQLEFRKVPELESEWSTRDEKGPDGKETGFEEILRNGQPVTKEELEARIFSKPPVLTGSDFDDAQPELSPTQGPIIRFSFKGEARKTFEDFTRANIGKPLAIFLDKHLISAPNIKDVIPGEGIIEGKFSPEQAKTFATNLRAGALPVPLEWESDLSVEATLGKQAVQQTTMAGVIGLLMVLIFMVGYYRLPGVLASLALGMYALFTFALYKAIPVTLTVPGIAGFILSIGMAVDANVLIFERLKEERLSGKSMRASIEAGFGRAFTAIFDSNACTLITCGILYWLGTGAVQGFALTLALGVAVSMFTAITCSRTMLLLVAGTAIGSNDANYALNRGLHPKLGVTRRMMFWFGVSGAIIIPGLVFWLGLNGTKYSIEFEGGTEISARFAKRPSIAELNRALAGLGFPDSRVLLAEGNRAYLTTKRQSAEQQIAVEKRIHDMGGAIETSSTVSGAISKELKYNAIYSVTLASILIVLYLAIRFAIGGVMEGFKFGVCAIGATLHDATVLWGLFAIFGYFLHWQVDLLFVTAMLTVIGFSTHDTIVIFDRIRENLKYRQRTETFAEVVDRSIEQTFARSINTSLTVILTLTSLLIWGGPVVRVFVAALLMGVISGTYSSIFNASPLLVLWRRMSGDRPAAAAASASAVRAGQRATPVAVPAPTAPKVAGPAPTDPKAVKPAAAAGEGEIDPANRIKAKGPKRARRM